MKITMYILFFFLTFMQKENIMGQNKWMKFSVEMPDTLCEKQLDISILLKVENLTSKSITIRNPAHWVNVSPHIRHDGKTVPQIKIKANLHLMKDTITIDGRGIFTVQFDYTLNALMGVEYCPIGVYEIYVIYEGKKEIESNVSNFVIRKCGNGK